MLGFIVALGWIIFYLGIPITIWCYGYLSLSVEKYTGWGHYREKKSGYWRCTLIYPLLFIVSSCISQCDSDFESHAVYHKDEKIPSDIVDYFNEQKKYPNVKFTINKGVNV